MIIKYGLDHLKQNENLSLIQQETNHKDKGTIGGFSFNKKSLTKKNDEVIEEKEKDVLLYDRHIKEIASQNN